jgi:dTDP-4-dehydrorhamnose 3,5-epimerase
MPFEKTEIPGVLIFEPVVYTDERGLFFEAYNEKVFSEAGVNGKWVQDNQSVSTYGVIRGLHYQLPPFAQAKLIRVLKGKILDVVVDILKGTPTYVKVFTKKLSEKNKRQLFIAAGLAHGFSVLSEKAEVLYKCDNFYNKEAEGGIIYNDPSLSIDWQVPGEKQIISAKDAALPLLEEARNSFVFEQE